VRFGSSLVACSRLRPWLGAWGWQASCPIPPLRTLPPSGRGRWGRSARAR